MFGSCRFVSNLFFSSEEPCCVFIIVVIKELEGKVRIKAQLKDLIVILKKRQNFCANKIEEKKSGRIDDDQSPTDTYFP